MGKKKYLLLFFKEKPEYFVFLKGYSFYVTTYSPYLSISSTDMFTHMLYINDDLHGINSLSEWSTHFSNFPLKPVV